MNLQLLGGNSEGTPLGLDASAVVARRLIERPNEARATRQTFQAALEQKLPWPRNDKQQYTFARQLHSPFIAVFSLDVLAKGAAMWNSNDFQPHALNSSLDSGYGFLAAFAEFQECLETHRLLADVALPYTVALWSFLSEAGRQVRDELVSATHIRAPVWRELVQLRINLIGAANNLERRTSFGLRPEADVLEVGFVENLVATVAINQGLFRASMSNKSDVEFDPTRTPLRLNRKTWLAFSPEVVRSTASGQCPFNEGAAGRADIWPEEIFTKSIFAHWCPAGIEADLSGLSVLDDLRDLGFDITDPKKVPLGKLFWQLSGCFADAVGNSVWHPSPLARYADQGTLDLRNGPLSLEQLGMAMSDLDIQSAVGRDSLGLPTLPEYA